MWALALAIGAIAAGGASIASAQSQASANDANLKMNSETNETNKQIASETNELQAQQFQQNMNWLREQYYNTQHYNSPKNMVARYQAAGINPYFAMGNSAGASASSSVGGASVPSYSVPHMESGHVEPINYDFSGLSDSVAHANDAYYQNEFVSEQTQAMRIENTYRAAKQLMELHESQSRIQQNLASAKVGSAQYELLLKQKEQTDQAINLVASQMEDLKVQPKIQNELAQAQTDYVKAQKEYQSIINRFAPDQQKKLLRNLDAEYDKILSEAKNNNAMAAHNAALEALTKAQEDGVKLDNDVKDSIADALVDKAFSEADAEYWRANQAAKGYREGHVSEYLPADDINGDTYNFNTHGQNRRRAFHHYSRKYKSGARASQKRSVGKLEPM